MEWPTIYQFRGDDEKYMIGSEVGSYLNLFKGALYKKYPKLWRRIITKEEKTILADLGVSNRMLANWEIMFIKASDGEAILRGEGHDFKGVYAPRITKQQLHSSATAQSQSICTVQQKSAKKSIKGASLEMHLGPLINTGQRNVLKPTQKNWEKREALRSRIISSK